MNDKKILILTMSCNLPHYKALTGAVIDTWAKPLIRGKYKNVHWFGYTACDDKHPNPMIDFDNHMIYVDTPDGLYNTYEKTQKAWEMIKDVVDFNYVVRTNASVFLNVENLLKRLSTLDNDVIVGRHEHNVVFYVPSKEVKIEFWLMWGFFFCMNKDFFDYTMGADKNFIEKCYHPGADKYTDDEIISLKINELLGFNYKSASIEHTQEDIIYSYKTYDPKDKTISKNIVEKVYSVHQDVVVTEPDEINNHVILRLRTFYDNLDNIGTGIKTRSEKGFELKHFYELNDAYKNSFNK